MISEQDKKQIAQWETKVHEIFQIRLVASPDKRSDLLKTFCEEFAALTPFVGVSTSKEDFGLPYIEIAGRLRYQAIPQNRELEQFLTALPFVKKSPRLSDRIQKKIDDITLPAALILFITPHCPHCPLLVRQIIPMVFSTSMLTLTIVDGQLFPEMAETFGVKSAPSLFLDDDFQWNGMVSIEELLNTLIQRDPSQLSGTTLKNLLKEGKAGLLADMMVRHGLIFPAFYSLLTNDKWPVRLGAMVAFEEIIHQNKDIAKAAIGPLLARFDEMDDQVKGDVIYLLGLLKENEIIPFFKKVEMGAYDEEVREAATDALAELDMK